MNNNPSNPHSHPFLTFSTSKRNPIPTINWRMRIIPKWIIDFLDINQGIFIDQDTMKFLSWFSTHRLPVSHLEKSTGLISKQNSAGVWYVPLAKNGQDESYFQGDSWNKNDKPRPRRNDCGYGSKMGQI